MVVKNASTYEKQGTANVVKIGAVRDGVERTSYIRIPKHLRDELGSKVQWFRCPRTRLLIVMAEQ